MSKKLYKKMSILFYEDDKMLHEEIQKMAINHNDSISTYAKRVFANHLNNIKNNK